MVSAHDDSAQMIKIRWLHLTDLHYGQKGQDHLWPNVREAFFERLARLHDARGPWDLGVCCTLHSEPLSVE